MTIFTRMVIDDVVIIIDPEVESQKHVGYTTCIPVNAKLEKR